MRVCGSCDIRFDPGSSDANECAVSVLVQYAMHLHVVPHAAHLSLVTFFLMSSCLFDCLTLTVVEGVVESTLSVTSCVVLPAGVPLQSTRLRV